MYKDENWTVLQGDRKKGFLDKVENPIDGKFKVDPATVELSYRPLPFYDKRKVALVRLHDRTWGNPRLNIYFLTESGNLSRLNGQSPPIHEINAKAPIQVTDDNVLDYLRFFCFFVRGEEGPFLISEDSDNPYFPENMDEQTRSVISGTVRPATYEGKNEQGFFLCDAVVFYSNALFIANFAIQPTGMIEMLDDLPIAGDLPSRVDAPIKG